MEVARSRFSSLLFAQIHTPHLLHPQLSILQLYQVLPSYLTVMKRSQDLGGNNQENEKQASKKVAKKTSTSIGDDDDEDTTVSWDYLFGDEQAVLLKNLNSFLHWKDRLVLGAVNKSSRHVYLQDRDQILRPVLRCLEGLCRSNIHEDCRKIYAPASQRKCTCSNDDPYLLPALDQPLAEYDPRYLEEYDSWSVHDKCSAMVLLVRRVVQNLRPHLQMDFRYASDPKRAAPVLGYVPKGWSLGVGVGYNAILKLYPRRATLAFNLLLVEDAIGTLSTGNNYNYEEAVRGEGGISPGGSSWSRFMAEAALDLMPFDNPSLEHFAKRLVPDKWIRDLLGESFTRQVCLAAPLLDWISDDGTVRLPSLEPFDADAAKQAVLAWEDED